MQIEEKESKKTQRQWDADRDWRRFAVCICMCRCVCVCKLLWIINPLLMITQQLLSRPKTLTTLIKDGALFSIYNTQVWQSQRCVNANYERLMGTSPDGIYRDSERATDGKTGLYLTWGRQHDRDDSRLTEVLDELYASDVVYSR